jgi:hypothetical protein
MRIRSANCEVCATETAGQGRNPKRKGELAASRRVIGLSYARSQTPHP